jgi:hypothetical protein
MRARTSGTPHDDEEYSFNFEAANELEDQLQRARNILGRLAAGLAGLDPNQPLDLRGVVERQHVLQAAEILLTLCTAIRITDMDLGLAVPDQLCVR